MIHVDDSELKVSGDMTYHQGQPFTGVGIDFHTPGKLAQEISYRNGLPHGVWKEWYKNEQISMESQCELGVKHGVTTKFFPSGRIKSLGEYEFGIETKFQEWDERGDLIASRELGPDSPGANYSLLLKLRERARTGIIGV